MSFFIYAATVFILGLAPLSTQANAKRTKNIVIQKSYILLIDKHLQNGFELTKATRNGRPIFLLTNIYQNTKNKQTLITPKAFQEFEKNIENLSATDSVNRFNCRSRIMMVESNSKQQKSTSICDDSKLNPTAFKIVDDMTTVMSDLLSVVRN